jgi:hypothetical protein
MWGGSWGRSRLMGWLWVGAVDGFGELFWGEAVEFSAGVEVGADVVFGE